MSILCHMFIIYKSKEEGSTVLQRKFMAIIAFGLDKEVIFFVGQVVVH